MNNKSSFIICFFLATSVVVVQSGWLLTSQAADCSSAPYSFDSQNGMCVLVYGRYQQIYCDGHTAKTYICSNSDCSSGCKLVQSTALNSCACGTTTHCYEQEPPYAKYVGNNYALMDIYDGKNCTGPSTGARVYPLNKCVNMEGDVSYSMTCDNGQVVDLLYQAADCTSVPPKKSIVGVDGVCKQNIKWKCV